MAVSRFDERFVYTSGAAHPRLATTATAVVGRRFMATASSGCCGCFAVALRSKLRSNMYAGTLYVRVCVRLNTYALCRQVFKNSF